MKSEPASASPEAVTAPDTGGKRRGVVALAAAVVAALLVLVYLPALRGEFVWDDLLLVQKNPLVTGELTPASLWFRTDFPLSVFGLWLQWLAWGAHAPGFHTVNLALHFLNALLLWRVLARAAIPGCSLAAALFAVHPLCVASVAWISEFKNVLSLTFALASVWCWLRAGQRNQFTDHARRRWLWYWLAPVAFALALFAKTSVVALPVFLLALMWWQNGKLVLRDVLHLAPFFLLALGFGAMTIWFQQHQLRLAENLEPQSFGERLAVAGMVPWFYLRRILAPLNLCAIYPRWQPDAASLNSYLPGVIWCGALAMCWWFRRKWGKTPFIAFGCFTAALFPVLGFFNFYFSALSRVSDHFVYLPIISVITLVAAILKRYLPARAFCVAATAIVLVLAAMAHQRARIYAEDEALWRDTLAKNPKAWTAHNNLACILAERNRLDDAMVHFEESLILNPRNASAHVNLGRVLAMRHQFAQAEPHFLAALELKPDDSETRVAYADALTSAGQNDAAIAQLEKSLRAKPTLDARLRLADLLRRMGRIREAIAQSREALKLKPDQPEVLSNLAWLLATSADDTLRNGKDAVEFAERACRLTKFGEPQMVGTLAAAYAEAGRFDEAIATARKAIDLANENGDLGFADVNRQLLQLYQSHRAYREGLGR